jgi:SAM-dependent methyltransferase
MADVPSAYRLAWENKPVLRKIYCDLYQRLVAVCRPGQTLEIGGGGGNLKRILRDVICTDIQPASWLDAVADAQALPFADSCFDNIVMFDVLHHLGRPLLLFKESLRTLRPGGRVVMIEPAITPISWLFYKLCHEEAVCMRVNPLAIMALTDESDPWDANQALPTLLLRRYRQQLEAAVPGFRVVRLEYLSLFTYPLSGGFKPWSLLPIWLVTPLLRLESVLLPFLGPLMAFRMLGVVEKSGNTFPEETEPKKLSPAHW